MPTYYANGVVATLMACPLEPTLSNVIDLRQGSEHRTDAARVQKLFTNARKLPEVPIGQDGSSKGVLRFIGANQDLPLYMVEAGDDVGKKRADGIADDMQGVQQISQLPVVSDDSSLTSLGATPTPTQQSFNNTPLKSKAPAVQPTSAPTTSESPLDAMLQSVDNKLTSGEQALVLEIDLSQKSFLPATPQNGPRSSGSGKDLKLEVFVNGVLADATFLPARKLVEVAKDKLRFSGLRLHRQIEKPWIYSPSESAVSSSGTGDASMRWKAVGEALVKEADERGQDDMGDSPPSAEYLTSLATLDFPEMLNGVNGIGVVDLVISVGKGKKYGPETAYITRPTRMDDSRYRQRTTPSGKLSQDPSPFYNPQAAFEDPFQKPSIMESSPDIPLRQGRTRAQTAHILPKRPSTPKKTVEDFASGFGIDLDPTKIKLGGYEKTSGKAGRGTRTIKQRFGDVAKMSPKNQEREIQKLKSLFGRTPGKTDNDPIKKLKFSADESIDLDTEMSGIDPAFLPDQDSVIAQDEQTISPLDMHKRWPHGSNDVQVPDPMTNATAPLTQTRTDMAANGGTSSDGYLLRSMAAASPQRTPQKKTTASALANSPTSVPVKKQTKLGRPKTPKRQKTTISPANESTLMPAWPDDTEGDLFASSSKLKDKLRAESNTAGTLLQSPSRGANRTSKRWDPKEETPTDALREFRVPEVCKASSVTYSEDEQAQRQVGKARRGEFKEEDLVVGIRFVVV